MAMSRDDFAAWLVQHCGRHATHPLPDRRTPLGREYFTPWLKEFERLGVDYEAASAASVRLVHQPPKAPRDHWPTLRRYAGEEIARRRAEEAARRLELIRKGETVAKPIDPDNPPVPPGKVREFLNAVLAQLQARPLPAARENLGRPKPLPPPPAEVVDGDPILWREYGDVPAGEPVSSEGKGT